MKIIAISQRIEYLNRIEEKRDCLDQRLVSFFLKADWD